MIENLLGNDGEEDSDEEVDGLFGAPDDEALDADGLMGDDLMGDDTTFDGVGEDDSATASEMKNRIDELENEVASLSSSVNTVRSENEQIGESLDDVEENVRKLLEIYEMVTRGVNPFVDETEIGDAFGTAGATGDGSMSLFDDASDGTETQVDESVVEADAEEFFADDLDGEFEEDLDGEFEEDLGDEFDDEFEEDLEDPTEEIEEDVSDDVGGTSFEELKSEYESGDADWGASEESDELDGAESDTSAAIDRPPSTGTAIDGDKPYLESLPPGYVTDVVVMDWLKFLVEEAGIDGAARTIAYYEAIEWLAESVAESLQTFLQGFGEAVEVDPEPRSSLTVAHHNSSLRFISRIANPSEAVAFDGYDGRLPGSEASGGSPLNPPRSVDRLSTPGATVPESSPDRQQMESDGGRRLTHERESERRDPEEDEATGSSYEEWTGNPETDEEHGAFEWGEDRS